MCHCSSAAAVEFVAVGAEEGMGKLNSSAKYAAALQLLATALLSNPLLLSSFDSKTAAVVLLVPRMKALLAETGCSCVVVVGEDETGGNEGEADAGSDNKEGGSTNEQA